MLTAVIMQPGQLSADRAYQDRFQLTDTKGLILVPVVWQRYCNN